MHLAKTSSSLVGLVSIRRKYAGLNVMQGELSVPPVLACCVVSSKIFHFELVGFVSLKIGIVQKVDSFIILIISEVCFKCIQIAHDNWLVLTRREAVDSAMGTLSLQIPVMLFLLFY